MKIKLKKITLKNFRGVSETFEFTEGKNTFSGPNGSGKTTLTWVTGIEYNGSILDIVD